MSYVNFEGYRQIFLNWGLSGGYLIKCFIFYIWIFTELKTFLFLFPNLWKIVGEKLHLLWYFKYIVQQNSS